MFPNRALDVVAEMGHPVGRPNQRRPLPHDRVGQPDTVGRVAERDVLPGRGRLRWWRRRLRGRVGDDGADELVAAAADGADVALGFPVVAQRPASRLDPACQRRLADEAPTPHGVEQLLLCDETVAIADELGQDVEHLRLDVDIVTVTAQFVALGVKDETVEPPHVGRRASILEEAKTLGSHLGVCWWPS